MTANLIIQHRIVLPMYSRICYYHRKCSEQVNNVAWRLLHFISASSGDKASVQHMATNNSDTESVAPQPSYVYTCRYAFILIYS